MFPQVNEFGANVFETQTFMGGGTDNTHSWSTWYKPAGCRFVAVWMIGAGGGGGGGFTGAAASARGGGGGGGAGALVRAMFLADMIPDTLFILAPNGGAGGSGSGQAGAAGTRSFVAVAPTFASGAWLLTSGAASAGGGGAGTAAAAGTAGAAGTISTTTTAGLQGTALLWVAQVGTAGSAGGAHTGATGANVTSADFTFTGGAGGAGTTSADFDGGNVAVNNAGVVPQISGGSAARGPNGASGFLMPKPWISRAGAGGQALNSAPGGRGGDAGPGCGGGGGGAGTTGGGGGNGGPGVVIITAF
jgi:hypothetical protein